MIRWDTDGRWVVATNGPGRSDGVSVVELASGTREQLVPPGVGGRADWLPDGERVAFLREAGSRMELVARRIDRSGPDSLLASYESALGISAMDAGPRGGWAVLVGGGPNELARDTLKVGQFFDRTSLTLSTWDVHPDGGFVFTALPLDNPRVHAIPDWRVLLARRMP